MQAVITQRCTAVYQNGLRRRLVVRKDRDGKTTDMSRISERASVFGRLSRDRLEMEGMFPEMDCNKKSKKRRCSDLQISLLLPLSCFSREMGMSRLSRHWASAG